MWTPSKPASTARRAPAAKAAITASICDDVASSTSLPVSALGTGEGASGSTPKARDWLPAWATWAKIRAPLSFTPVVSSRRPGIISSAWMPT